MTPQPVRYAATDSKLLVMGRTQTTLEGRLRIGYPGVTLRFAFEGTEARLQASCTSADCILLPFVDGQRQTPLRLKSGSNDVTLVTGLPSARHQMDLVRQTETWLGIMTLEGLMLPDGHLVDAEAFPARQLLFIGDSVTSGEAAGHRKDCTTDKAPTWDAYGSYGMRVGRALGAQVHLVSYGGRGLVRDWQGKTDTLNAPQFFELSVPEDAKAGAASLAWDHKSYVPDAVVVSLGTNDFNLALGPFPEEKHFVQTYVAFLERIRALYPNAPIVITEGAIVNDFDRSFGRTTLRRYLDETVATLEDPKVSHAPSKHYPGDTNNPHPTGEQHRQMAKDLEPALRKALDW